MVHSNNPGTAPRAHGLDSLGESETPGSLRDPDSEKEKKGKEKTVINKGSSSLKKNLALTSSLYVHMHMCQAWVFFFSPWKKSPEVQKITLSFFTH